VIKISNSQPKMSKLKLFFNKLKGKSSKQNYNLEITGIYKTNDINPIDETINTNTTDKEDDLKTLENINNLYYNLLLFHFLYT